MSVRKRLLRTANRSLLSSLFGLLILLVTGNILTYDAFHLLSPDKIQSFQQLSTYAQSDKSYALISSSNVVNTEIYVTIDEFFGEKNYYGYIAQLDDKYFLFFSSKDGDVSSGSMILSKWWSQSESMNVFRQMVVDDLSNSSDFSKDEVDELVYSEVFLSVDDIIESSLPLAILWGFVMFVLSLIFYKSLKVKLGLFTDQIESVVLDYDLGFLKILYQNKDWTIGESHLLYHKHSFRILNMHDVREVRFYSNRMCLMFKNYKTTIYGSEQLIDSLTESWKIQRRRNDEPINQL